MWNVFRTLASYRFGSSTTTRTNKFCGFKIVVLTFVSFSSLKCKQRFIGSIELFSMISFYCMVLSIDISQKSKNSVVDHILKDLRGTTP